ncbi:hypothetical protein NIES23_50410 [Trichormus variabilis NIES-23]|uniref:Uncharacterized protein n=1 Tax=Trichormus variabilis NIES-23 TaxID=1973479 RepID=A0A1Z4KTD0_ANAVA|nr:hypothetical protein NIES23_50410 [Trichormus variabilis NIES-23]
MDVKQERTTVSFPFPIFHTASALCLSFIMGLRVKIENYVGEASPQAITNYVACFPLVRYHALASYMKRIRRIHP